MEKYDGQIFLLYLLWYGFGRFFIEGIRTDSLMWGPYRISQLLAAVCVIVSVILLIVFRNRREIFGEEGLKLQLAEEAIQLEEKKAMKAEKAAARKAKKEGKTASKNGMDQDQGLPEEEKQADTLSEETAETAVDDLAGEGLQDDADDGEQEGLDDGADD